MRFGVGEQGKAKHQRALIESGEERKERAQSLVGFWRWASEMDHWRVGLEKGPLNKQRSGWREDAEIFHI